MLARFLRKLSLKLPARVIRQNYMNRYFLFRAFGFTCYLHEWIAEDQDESVHDHPWRFSAGIPLVGGYKEERLKWLDPAKGVVSKKRTARWMLPNIIWGWTFHKITNVKPGSWTLFIHSNKRIKDWGFLNPVKTNMVDGHIEREVFVVEYNPGPLPSLDFSTEWWQRGHTPNGHEMFVMLLDGNCESEDFMEFCSRRLLEFDDL